MKFSSLSFKQKTIALLALPVIAFLWLSASASIKNYQEYSAMSELSHLSQLAQAYSELVHEIQKERGTSAGFLGSKGTKFKNKLRQQRQETNKKIQARLDFLKEQPFSQEKIIKINRIINQNIQGIDNIRQKVDTLNIDLASALQFYTQLNAQLLSVPSLIAELSKDPDISREVVAYYNFLQGKERAGIERAVLSNTFAQNNFAAGMYKKFIVLVSEQHTYFHNFLTFTSPESKTFYEASIDNTAVENVMKMRNIAFAKASQGGFNIEPLYWFEQATGRIKQLKEIDNYLNAQLLEHSVSTAHKYKNKMFMGIVISLAILLLVIIAGFYIIKSLTTQVNELVNVMTKVKSNNDLTLRIKNIPENELGDIAKSLNSILDTFSVAVNKISLSSVNLSETSAETSETCVHNSESMNQQQDQITLIATAVEELSMTIKEVAENTQSTSDSAKAADTLSKEGLKVVQTSYLSIEDLAQEIIDLSSQINTLHESSKQITTVVDVIKSVAEQTNLLALNAAIEAARAGEQGRGFAVVADEVRTLAQRTQQSTSEIDAFINSLQENATAAHEVIEKSQNKATLAVENSKMVESSLESINAAIDTIVSMSEQVAVAVEEQSTVTHDVAQNIVNIEGKSMESTSGAIQIAATAKEQASLSMSLKDIASTFKVA